MGDDTVVNFSAPPGRSKSKSDARIMRVGLTDFRDSSFVRVYKYGVGGGFFSLERPGTCTRKHCHCNDKTVEIAELLAEHPWDFGDYNLITRNCEGFANFCKTTPLTVQEIRNMSRHDVLDTITSGYGHQATVKQVVLAIVAVPYAPVQGVCDVVKWLLGR